MTYHAKWLGSRRMLSARAAESVGIMAVRGEQQSHARYFPSSRRAAVMTAGQIVGRNGPSALGSVSAAYVQALLDTAAARGADRALLVADAGTHTPPPGAPRMRSRSPRPLPPLHPAPPARRPGTNT